MTKKAAMPKSKAKTAYGLLSEIRQIILDEPKRYDQRYTLTIGAACEIGYGFEAPACGTVGCVAGWTVALRGRRRNGGVCARAARILGLSEQQGYDLFDAYAAGRRDDVWSHAERGAQHIAKFQEKYAAQLKAKRV